MRAESRVMVETAVADMVRGSYVVWVDRDPATGDLVNVAGWVDRVDGGAVYVALDAESVIVFGDHADAVGPVVWLRPVEWVRPGLMSPGVAIMVPDGADPLGGRYVPRVVREAWSADTGGSVGRWLIDFDDAGEGFDGGTPWIGPFRLATSFAHTYRVAAGYVRPDYSGLRLSSESGGESVRVHRDGELVAIVESGTLSGRVVWHLAEFYGTADGWLTQRWLDRDAAIRWVWAHTTV